MTISFAGSATTDRDETSGCASGTVFGWTTVETVVVVLLTLDDFTLGVLIETVDDEELEMEGFFLTMTAAFLEVFSIETEDKEELELEAFFLTTVFAADISCGTLKMRV
jgi:hypothetical protein